MNQKRLKIAKFLLPIALVCVIPLWVMLMKEMPIPTFVYVLAGIGAAAFLLDRILKPWDMERAERIRKQAEEQEADRRARIAEAEAENREE